MSKSMEIRLNIQGITKAEKAAQAINDLAKAYRNLNSATGGNGGSLNIGGNTNVGGGSPRSSGPRGGGPFSNLGRAQAGLSSAIVGGNPTTVADAQYRLMQAQKAAARAQQMMSGGPGSPSFMQRLQTFASSTRFGTGGAMPLVGRSLDLIGLGKMAGPIMAVTAGLVGMAKAVEMANKNIIEFGRLQSVGGGTSDQTRRAEMAARSVGMTPSEYMDRARQAQKDYYDDPTKGAIQRAYGYEPPGVGRTGRNTNAVDSYNRMIQRILRNKNRDQALRDLQNIGMEQFAPLIGKDSEINTVFGGSGNPPGRDDQSDAIRRNSRMEGALKVLEDIGNNIGAAIGNLAGLNRDDRDSTTAPGGVFAPRRKAQSEQKDIQVQQLHVQKKMLDGINAIAANTRTFAGGGQGLNNSVPKGWQFILAADDAVQKQAIALGAFGI